MVCVLRWKRSMLIRRSKLLSINRYKPRIMEAIASPDRSRTSQFGGENASQAGKLSYDLDMTGALRCPELSAIHLRRVRAFVRDIPLWIWRLVISGGAIF
jgi:hypothetical protein